MIETVYIESQCGDDKLRNLSIELEDETIDVYGEYFNDNDIEETYSLTPDVMVKVKSWMKKVKDCCSPDEALNQLHKIVD